MMILPLIVFIGVIGCIALAQHHDVSPREYARLDGLERMLGLRWLPVALGMINALLVWWWNGWLVNPPSTIHDEAAYLLQAEIFARGRWTGTPPVLPEFFAQMHVFTTPVLASKYPPGFSLLLTPFVAMGFSALALMVFAAITGGIVFALARRVAGGGIAVLTWILWSSSSAILRYQASFLSQAATLWLWLGTLFLLLEYRTHHRPWMLGAIGACIGTLAITRPVTAVALAIPVGIVIIQHVWRARAWRSLGIAALLGTGIVAILPIQNHQTTGDWRRSPLIMYAEKYAPFDLPGFGYDSSQATTALPPDLDSVRTYLTEARRQHTLPALPATIRSRSWYATLDVFTGWRAPFLIFALIGVVAMPAVGLFALAASVGLLLTHLFHAHWAYWTAYYVEGYPAIVFASAVGMFAVAEWMLARRSIWTRWPRRDMRNLQVRAAVIAICAFLVIPATIVLPRYRTAWQRNTFYERRFTTALALIQRESEHSIVFVDYGRNHDVHRSLVWNVPDLSTAKSWIAYERGHDDLRLMRLAPNRRAYIFRADVGQLTRLPPIAEIERLLAERTK